MTARDSSGPAPKFDRTVKIFRKLGSDGLAATRTHPSWVSPRRLRGRGPLSSGQSQGHAAQVKRRTFCLPQKAVERQGPPQTPIVTSNACCPYLLALQ